MKLRIEELAGVLVKHVRVPSTQEAFYASCTCGLSMDNHAIHLAQEVAKAEKSAEHQVMVGVANNGGVVVYCGAQDFRVEEDEFEISAEKVYELAQKHAKEVLEKGL